MILLRRLNHVVLSFLLVLDGSTDASEAFVPSPLPPLISPLSLDSTLTTRTSATYGLAASAPLLPLLDRRGCRADACLSLGSPRRIPVVGVGAGVRAAKREDDGDDSYNYYHFEDDDYDGKGSSGGNRRRRRSSRSSSSSTDVDGDEDALRKAWAAARERRMSSLTTPTKRAETDNYGFDAGGFDAGGVGVDGRRISPRRDHKGRKGEDPQPQSQMQGKRRREGRGGEGTARRREGDASSSSSISNFVSPSAPSPPSAPPTPRLKSSDVLRSSKSIEQLEQALAGRWGTRLSRWTADPSEYELVYDDDDNDDGNYDNDDSPVGGKNDNGGIATKVKVGVALSPGFRSKPVLNPWEKAERDEKKNSTRAAESETAAKKKTKNIGGPLRGRDETLSLSSSSSSSSSSSTVLDRVRKNQERMKQEREEKIEARRRARTRGAGEPQPSSSLSSSLSSSSKSDSRHGRHVDDDRTIITGASDLPSGSVLELSNAEWKKDDTIDTGIGNSGSESDNNFFFFRPSTPTAFDSDPRSPRSLPSISANVESQPKEGEEEKEEEDALRTSRKRTESLFPPTRPVLDEYGNEILLTLERAAFEARKFLGEDGNCSDVGNLGFTQDDDDDDAPPPAISFRSTSSFSSFSSRAEWEELGVVHPTLLSNLHSKPMRCPRPLPVQVRAIPPSLAGTDVVVSSHTGSGKTLAYLVPIAQRLLFDDMNEVEEKEEDAAAVVVKTKRRGKLPRAIVIVPGRELASQIVSVARDLFQNTGLRASLAIGGTPYRRTADDVRRSKPDLIVGTPGRIAELVLGGPSDDMGGIGARDGTMKRRRGGAGGRMKTSGLRTLVLDEFDALLGYDAHRDPTEAIVKALLKAKGSVGSNGGELGIGGEQGGNEMGKQDNVRTRMGGLQTILCSATAVDVMGGGREGRGQGGTKKKKSLVDGLVRPGYAHAASEDDDALLTDGGGDGDHFDGNGGEADTTTAEKKKARVSRTAIHGTVQVPHRRLKMETLRRILNAEPMPPQALIFVDGSRRVQLVVDKLAEMGIVAAPLHGGSTSRKSDRAEASRALRDGYVGVVVSTELAARGIDAPYLTHVINLDLPTDSSHYAHRAGRCGRGGRAGVVVNIAVGMRERSVPDRFAEELGIDMHRVEARGGKLVIVEDVVST